MRPNHVTDSGRRQGVEVDVEPVEVARRRPHSDFAEWAEPSLLAMTRLALRLAPDADPEDVVQEALTRAWLKWSQYDPERGTPTTWLLAITADQARTARRTRLRRLRLVDDSRDLALPTAIGPGHGSIPRLDTRHS